MPHLRLWKQLSILLSVVALVSAGSASAVQATGGRSHAGTGKQLILDVSTGQDTLDPSATVQLGPASNVAALYGRLTQLGSTRGPAGTTMADPSKVVPWLAKSWTLSNHHRVYTFHLRHGMKFANGDPITAADVKYTFDRNAKMGLGGIFFLTDGITGNVKSVATRGKYTAIITLKQPDPNILQSWWTPDMGIVDAKVVQAHGGVQAGKTNAWMSSHVAGGSGPYILTGYQPDTQLVFAPNPHYTAGPKPGESKLVENVIHSDATLLLRARSGAADVTQGLSYASVNSLRHNKNVRIIADPTTNMEELEFNNKAAPLNNVKFRQALAYAVPYAQILRHVAYGYGQLFGGPLPPAMPFFNRAISNASPYKFDLAKARALLQQSKVSLPVTLTDSIEEGNATQEQISTIIQALWGTLGVHLTIQRLAPSDYTSSLFAHKTQVFLREDGPGVIDPGYFLGYDITGCAKANFSLSNICIPGTEKMLAEARSTTSKAKRQKLFNEIGRLWIKYCPKVNLYSMKAITVVSTKVTKYDYSIFGSFQNWRAR